MHASSDRFTLHNRWNIAPRSLGRVLPEGETGERIVRNRLGISAYNRQREFVAGKNSKGTPPGLKLEPRRIGVVIGYGEAEERYVEVADDLTADALELIVQALRVVPGRLAFCAARDGIAITSAELAKRHGQKKPLRKPMPRSAA